MQVVDARELFRGAYAGLRPPRRLGVVDWAESHIELDAKYHGEPGKLRIRDRTPYMVEPLESFTDPHQHEVVLMCATQTMKSMVFNVLLAYMVAEDPGPALYQMADREACRKIAREKIHPFFDSPKLAKYVPRERSKWTQVHMDFGRMTLDMAWSGSPSALAASSKRIIFQDEIDKYPLGGHEGDPAELGEERTRTFWNYKILKASTPSDESSRIHVEYEKTDRRRYHVPCPFCGTYQVLRFSSDEALEFDADEGAAQASAPGRLRWPDDVRDPDRIAIERLAWYECASCRGEIRDGHKPWMLKHGVWCPAGCRVVNDAQIGGKSEIASSLDPAPRNDNAPVPRIEGDIPLTRARGYHLNALYSPWRDWSSIAAAFLSDRENPWSLRNFVNSTLADVYRGKVKTIDEGALDAASARGLHALPEGAEGPVRVPEGVEWVTLGVDVQEKLLYYIVRGWGYGQETWLLDCGTTASFKTLWDDVVMRGYVRPRFDESGDHVAEWMPVRVVMGGVDRRYRTDEVDAFCREHSGQDGTPVMRAIRSADGRQRVPYNAVAVDKDRRGKALPNSWKYWSIDAHLYKDWLASMSARLNWHLPANLTDEYKRHFTSEQLVPKRSGGLSQMVWVKRSANRPNHLWDCEVYDLAAADMARILLQKGPGPKTRPAPAAAGRGGRPDEFLNAGKDFLNR